MSSNVPDAIRYARIRHRLLLADLAIGAVFLWIAQRCGASSSLARWWSARVAWEPLVLLGYLAVFGLAYYLATLPLHVYGSFVLEHRFGLSRLSARGWLVREAKQLAIGACVSAGLIEGFYALLRHTPRMWPLWATIGWVGFSVLLARIFPTVLLPIFYKTAPLEDHALVQRLLDLCKRVGLSALGVFRFNLGAETRKANAALAGLGRTRRVLLSDTLINDFTHEEIEGVLAHELAHHRYHHITKLLALSAVGSWIAFVLTDVAGRYYWMQWFQLGGLADISGFPMLALWLSGLGLLSLPLQNGISRAFERQADRFAVETTQHSQAFADALQRLSTLNLADPNPPRWIVWFFFDHPPITERIRAAEHPSGDVSFE